MDLVVDQTTKNYLTLNLKEKIKTADYIFRPNSHMVYEQCTGEGRWERKYFPKLRKAKDKIDSCSQLDAFICYEANKEELSYYMDNRTEVKHGNPIIIFLAEYSPAGLI